MKINLSGHHVEVTDSIREHINEKFSKIESHFPSLIALDIILSKEHHKIQAEISTNYEGTRISVKGENEVMYPAIASAAKKTRCGTKTSKRADKSKLTRKAC
ncbi:ribosomal subunit interface protein [Pseudoalteromonas distincta]|nr:ribosomal subunit interface protein [Pseudoalteromonas distincta]